MKSVAEVLADPASFIGETLSDPLEGPSYGRCKAMVMEDDGGGLFVHSFAHGGMGYRLMLDENMLRETDPRRRSRRRGDRVFAEALGPRRASFRAARRR